MERRRFKKAQVEGLRYGEKRRSGEAERCTGVSTLGSLLCNGHGYRFVVRKFNLREGLG